MADEADERWSTSMAFQRITRYSTRSCTLVTCCVRTLSLGSWSTNAADVAARSGACFCAQASTSTTASNPIGSSSRSSPSGSPIAAALLRSNHAHVTQRARDSQATSSSEFASASRARRSISLAQATSASGSPSRLEIRSAASSGSPSRVSQTRRRRAQHYELAAKTPIYQVALPRRCHEISPRTLRHRILSTANGGCLGALPK